MQLSAPLWLPLLPRNLSCYLLAWIFMMVYRPGTTGHRGQGLALECLGPGPESRFGERLPAPPPADSLLIILLEQEQTDRHTHAPGIPKMNHQQISEVCLPRRCWL